MHLFPNSRAVVVGLPTDFALSVRLKAADSIRLVTAFAHKSGWKHLAPALHASRAAKFLLAGSSFFQTEPDVLRDWQKLAKQSRCHAKLNVNRSPTFHPKVLIVEGRPSFAIVGSGNLSNGGLIDNEECSLYTQNETDLKALITWFDNLFDRSLDLLDGVLDDYEVKRNKYRAVAKKAEKEQHKLEEEFSQESTASLKRWEAAVRIARAYFKSSEFPQHYKARQTGAEQIRTALRYPNFDFDRKGWEAFYKVPELGHLIPIRKHSIYKKKRRLQKGLRELIGRPNANSLDAFLSKSGQFHIDGLGLNAITKILAVHNPTKWFVYNNPVAASLKNFGYAAPRGKSEAEKLMAYNAMMEKLRGETDAKDAFALDCFFFHYDQYLKRKPDGATSKLFHDSR